MACGGRASPEPAEELIALPRHPIAGFRCRSRARRVLKGGERKGGWERKVGKSEDIPLL